ncbi:ATP-binding protein [Halalkalibacter alkalisediminis]|uniref:histidine kinase n=1 Tax=Halalkalibacter alkalisediminis TaxID=935616 RepID=A0ABV6NDF5_9BACI|nr:ATP-binding protein [Halalkalibacter alkalisediminis]
MKLKTKLILGLGTIILIIILLSVTVYNTLDRQNESLREVVLDNYTRVMLSQELKNEMNIVAREVRELLLIDTESEQSKKVTTINQSLHSITRMYNTLDEVSSNDREKNVRIVSIQDLHLAYSEMVQNVIMLATTESTELARNYLFEQNIRFEMLKEIDALVELEEQTLLSALVESDQAYERAMTILAIFIVASIGIVVFITYIIIKNISTGINHVRKIITSVPSHALDNLPRINNISTDEIGDISNAYNEMAAALEKVSKQEKQVAHTLKEENWIKSRYAEIAMKIQGIQELNEFGETFMTNVAQFVRATHGVIYIKDESTKLKKLASYAGTEERESEMVESIDLGKGLVGQCAADNRVMQIDPLPKGYITTKSGLGESTPTSLILLPIVFEGDVLGVVELAKFESFTESEISILRQVCQASGSSIKRILHHVRIEELLAESQTQAEELQTQAEELQQQQEELRLINEQLHEQYKQSDGRKKELEMIKEDLEDKNRSIKLVSRYKSEFLANMSHELRTPLNSMLILSQLLAENQNGNLTNVQVEHANTIFTSGTDLLNLINDILDLSKIESGKMEVYPEEVPISDVRAFVERQFMPVSNQKDLNFKINIDESAPTIIFSDDQRLKQILKNLLSNAFKFTSKGSVELQVKKGPESEGMKVSFSVVDTGIGITKEKQQQIFEAFYQEDGTITRKFGGTGLGLSISRELSELLGGYIEVESIENQGSQFTLHLPDLNSMSVVQKLTDEVAVTLEEEHIKLEQQHHEVKDEVVCPKYVSNSELQDKCILVVDDDMRNVFALTTALEMQKVKVVFAENGKESLTLLEKEPVIDLVLMDIMMPEMNGYEAMEAIRKNEKWEDLPIIALTAKAMKSDKEKCIKAGASDYISKPVNMEQLLSLIKVWLHK